MKNLFYFKKCLRLFTLKPFIKHLHVLHVWINTTKLKYTVLFHIESSVEVAKPLISLMITESNAPSTKCLAAGFDRV